MFPLISIDDWKKALQKQQTGFAANLAAAENGGLPVDVSSIPTSTIQELQGGQVVYSSQPASAIFSSPIAKAVIFAGIVGVGYLIWKKASKK